LKLRTYIGLAALLLAACASDQPALTAANIDLSPPISGVNMGAAYMTLTNNSDQDITITRVSSPELHAVAMHESVLEDGVSRMVKLQQLDIAAQQSVTFERGAKHLMLRYPDDKPDRVTLQFYAEDTLLLSLGATVKE
jgi:copper(I)-binding protein